MNPSLFFARTLLFSLLFLSQGAFAQEQPIYQTLFPGSGVNVGEDLRLISRSEKLDSALLFDDEEVFRVFSSSGYHLNGYAPTNDNVLFGLLNTADASSDAYVFFWWPTVLGGHFDELRVIIDLSEKGALNCLEDIHFSTLEVDLNREAKIIIESLPSGTFEDVTSHAVIEARILDRLVSKVIGFGDCCNSQQECVLCTSSNDIKKLQPLSSFEKVYPDTGSYISAPGVSYSDGSNYSITIIDEVSVFWDGVDKGVEEIIEDYLSVYGKEVSWKVLVTGKEVCNAEDQGVVNDFFNPAVVSAKPDLGTLETKVSLNESGHILYVYLDENNRLRSQVSTLDDYYHPVDFKVEKVTRLGLISYPTLNILPRNEFVGPIESNSSHFAGHTPTGSLIALPFGSIVSFYPGDNGEWPKGSVGGFQTGNRVFWGAWDNQRERPKFLGYVCKEAINYGDLCDPEPNPTFYLPKSRDENDELYVIGAIVAAKLGYPDTCHIYGASLGFKHNDKDKLHVNYSRDQVEEAGDVMPSLGLPENIYKEVGLMPSSFCFQSEERYCRHVLSGHKYLADNNPLSRVLLNNPCLVLDFEHVNFQISLGVDEEMEALKNVIALAIMAPLAGVAFEIIAIEQGGALLIRNLISGGRALTKATHYYIRQEVSDLAQDQIIKKASRDFMIGVAVDLSLQSAILTYTLPADSLKTPNDYWKRINYPSLLVSGTTAVTAPLDGSKLEKLAVAGMDGLINCALLGAFDQHGDPYDEFHTNDCLLGLGFAAAIRFAMPSGAANQLHGLSRVQGVRLLTKMSSSLADDFSDLGIKAHEAAPVANGVSFEWLKETWAIIRQNFSPNSGLDANMSKNIDLLSSSDYSQARKVIDALQESGTNQFDDAIAVLFGQNEAIFKRLLENDAKLFKDFCEDFKVVNGSSSSEEIISIISGFINGQIQIAAWVRMYNAEIPKLVRSNASNLENITNYLVKSASFNSQQNALLIYHKIDGTHFMTNAHFYGFETGLSNQKTFSYKFNSGPNAGSKDVYGKIGLTEDRYLVANIIKTTSMNNEGVEKVTEDAMDMALKHFEKTGKVNGVKAAWVQDANLYPDLPGNKSVNLLIFEEALETMTPSEAAFQTITGGYANSRVFKDVSEIRELVEAVDGVNGYEVTFKLKN